MSMAGYFALDVLDNFFLLSTILEPVCENENQNLNSIPCNTGIYGTVPSYVGTYSFISRHDTYRMKSAGYSRVPLPDKDL